eukprot:2815274-Pleurochrysis_carterae.AAC.5
MALESHSQPASRSSHSFIHQAQNRISECVGYSLRCTLKLPGANNFISNREIPLAESYFMN